jgi:hypothetical protein
MPKLWIVTPTCFFAWVEELHEPVLYLAARSDSGTGAGMTVVNALVIKTTPLPFFAQHKNVIPVLYRNLTCPKSPNSEKHSGMLCFAWVV